LQLTSKQHKGSDIRRGREYLCWCLLQYISVSIHKSQLTDFLPVVKLINLLYPETEVRSECLLFQLLCSFMLSRKERSSSSTFKSLCYPFWISSFQDNFWRHCSKFAQI